MVGFGVEVVLGFAVALVPLPEEVEELPLDVLDDVAVALGVAVEEGATDGGAAVSISDSRMVILSVKI